MTPDGISTEDWDRIHELALEVVNRSADEDETGCDDAARRLLAVLDALEEKYGSLPSLLATRADYVEDPAEQLCWLTAAYEAAQRLGDVRNLVFTASSLASLYAETEGDVTAATGWLDRLEAHLETWPDPDEAEELARLRAVVAGATRGTT